MTNELTATEWLFECELCGATGVRMAVPDDGQVMPRDTPGLTGAPVKVYSWAGGRVLEVLTLCEPCEERLDADAEADDLEED